MPELEPMSYTWTLLSAASLSSVLAWLGTGNVLLFLVALAMQTLEIVTEWGSKARRRHLPFDAKGNIGGKLMVLSLVLVAALLDRVFIFLSPESIAASVATWMWVTKSTLVWIIIGEAVCIVRHIEKSEGETAIPPVVRWVIRQIRVMDQKRWPGPAGQKPPRRWYDDLTEEDIADLMKKMEERREKGEPTEYIAQHPKEAVREGVDNYPPDRVADVRNERGEI